LKSIQDQDFLNRSHRIRKQSAGS